MKIITFTTDDPDVPIGLRSVSLFLYGSDYLPVRITAPTPERAEAKAQEFWDTERAKVLPKPRKATRKPPTVPVTATSVDDDLLGAEPAAADDDDLLG